MFATSPSIIADSAASRCPTQLRRLCANMKIVWYPWSHPLVVSWMPGQCGRNLDCPEDSCIDSTTAPDDPEYSWIRWTAPADAPATRSSSSSSSSASRWWWLHNSSASRWWWLQQLQRSGPLFDRWWTRWRMNCWWLVQNKTQHFVRHVWYWNFVCVRDAYMCVHCHCHPPHASSCSPPLSIPPTHTK